MAYVYEHIRLDTNEIFYIGIGNDLNYQRAYQKKSRNKHWKNIVNITNYSVNIIFDNLSWEDACFKEIELIKKYGRKDLNNGILVNMTDGGEGLNNPSFETRNKIRKFYSGKTRIEIYGFNKANEITQKIVKKNKGKTRSNEFKIKQSIRFMGENNPMFGKKQSDEFKNLKREYFLGENNPGKNKTDETKKKISRAKKGIPSKFKGIPRKKIICPHCGKIGGEGLMNRWHFDNCKFKMN